MSAEDRLIDAVARLEAAEGRAATRCDLCNAARSLAVEYARADVMRYALQLAKELVDEGSAVA